MLPMQVTRTEKKDPLTEKKKEKRPLVAVADNTSRLTAQTSLSHSKCLEGKKERKKKNNDLLLLLQITRAD